MIGSKEAAEAALLSGPQSSFPETEDGLVWDMLGQLGQLLKINRRDAILPGFAKPHVFMDGVSQSAIYIRTWIAGFHDRYRTADGRPVYDGYLGIVGPAMIRINQCSADIALDDPVQKLIPPDVPFISISSEGEMWQARFTHQPDAFTPRGGIVSYEVAGASHMAGDVPGVGADRMAFASVADMVKAGMQMPKGAVPGAIPPGARPNDFVWLPLQRGAFHNLELWARDGVRPPLAPRIELDASHEIRRDRYGNALGGLRMPYIDVPLAAHTGYLTPGGMGGVMGIKRPFAKTTLAQLYPAPGSYAAQFSAATDRLLARRFISAEDAGAMKRAAQSVEPDKLPAP